MLIRIKLTNYKLSLQLEYLLMLNIQVAMVAKTRAAKTRSANNDQVAGGDPNVIDLTRDDDAADVRTEEATIEPSQAAGSDGTDVTRTKIIKMKSRKALENLQNEDLMGEVSDDSADHKRKRMCRRSVPGNGRPVNVKRDQPDSVKMEAAETSEADVRPTVEQINAVNNNDVRSVIDGSHFSQSSGNNTERTQATEIEELLRREAELEKLLEVLKSRPTGDSQVRFVVFLYYLV